MLYVTRVIRRLMRTFTGCDRWARTTRPDPVAWLALAVLAGLGVALGACDNYIADADTAIPPRVTDFSVSPDSLDLTDHGDTATVTVGARAGTGIDSLVVVFRGAGGDAQRTCGAVEPMEGTETDGRWGCELRLDRFDPVGEWVVFGLRLFAGEELLLDVGEEALAEAGYERTVDVVRRPLTVEGVAVERDTVQVFEDAAAVPIRMTLTGPVLDSVRGTLTGPDTSAGCTADTPIDGTRGDGTWACTALIPQGAPAGGWPVSVITAYPSGLDPVTFGPDTLAAVTQAAVHVALPPVDFVVVTLPRDTLRSQGDTTRADATAYDAQEVPLDGATFSWSSSAPAVATVDSAGLVTAVSEGAAWIRAATGGVTDSARIAVAFVSPIDSVALAPAADTLIDRGDTVRYTFTAYDTAGAALDTSTTTWWSVDSTVATVDSTGLATSRAGGTVTLHATLGGDTASATLRVEPIAFITLSPFGTARRAVADTFSYSARFYTWNERTIDGLNPTWTSSDPTVAAVDSTGQVVPLTPGSAVITVEAEDSTESRTVEVVEVAAVDIVPESYFFEFEGQVEQFIATATDANGDTVQVDITWSSSDTSVVTTVTGGYVTARGHGLGQVYASAGTAMDSSSVAVDLVSFVVMQPFTDTLTAIGDTARYVATAYDASEQPLPDVGFTWSVVDTAIATVDSTGLVTAVDSGSTTVVAVSEPPAPDTAAATVEVVVQPPPFTYTSLGYLGAEPGDFDNAYAINDNGWVVGRAQNDAGDNVAFVYMPDIGIQEIGTFPNPSFAFSIAWDINANNVVVGQSGHEDGDQAAFYWTETDGMVDIGDLAGRGAKARGVNDSLQIVGESNTGFGYSEAFLWDPDTGTMTSLGNLPGGEGSNAWGINNAGTVAGIAVTEAGNHHAFVWTPDGGMIDLGTLGGPTSMAFAINEDGVVIGFAETAEEYSRAVVWLPPYGAEDIVELGTYEGPESTAYDANSDVAVGWAETADGTNIGVAFADLSVVPIEIDGMFVNTIRGINSFNQMVGTADIDGVNTMIMVEPNQ